MSTPRLKPVGNGEVSSETAQLLSRVSVPGAPASNIFGTLARHERLYRRWQPLATKLFHGELDPVDRELLILRTAIHVESEYEWAQHYQVAQSIGISLDEIRDLVFGRYDSWPPVRQLLMTACTELLQNRRLTEDTWAELARNYSDKQIIEICMLPGFYIMIGFLANSVNIEIEAEGSYRTIAEITDTAD